jgi:hypothetical protein
MKKLFLLICCISLLGYCVVSQPQEVPRCKWNTCGVGVGECPAEYPFRLESSACLRPDGARCSSGVSALCCQTKSRYDPYWVGGPPPNCFANCSDCDFNDFCYGFTRMCDGSGNVCEFGSQILCGRPATGGSLRLDRGIISIINLVSILSFFDKIRMTLLFSYISVCMPLSILLAYSYS